MLAQKEIYQIDSTENDESSKINFNNMDLKKILALSASKAHELIKNLTPKEVLAFGETAMGNLLAAIIVAKTSIQEFMQEINAKQDHKDRRAYNSVMNKLKLFNLSINKIRKKLGIKSNRRCNKKELNRLKNLTSIELEQEVSNFIIENNSSRSGFLNHHNIKSQEFSKIWNKKELTNSWKYLKKSKTDEAFDALLKLSNEEFINTFTSREKLVEWANSIESQPNLIHKCVRTALKLNPDLNKFLKESSKKGEEIGYLKSMLTNRKVQSGENKKNQIKMQLDDAFKSDQDFINVCEKTPSQIANLLGIERKNFITNYIGEYFQFRLAKIKYLSALYKLEVLQSSLLTKRSFDASLVNENAGDNINDADDNSGIKEAPVKKLHQTEDGDTIFYISSPNRPVRMNLNYPSKYFIFHLNGVDPNLEKAEKRLINSPSLSELFGEEPTSQYTEINKDSIDKISAFPTGQCSKNAGSNGSWGPAFFVSKSKEQEDKQELKMFYNNDI